MSATKKFKVTLCRVENTIYEYTVRAHDAEAAEDVAWDLFNEGEPADREEVVHAEEFTHETREV